MRRFAQDKDGSALIEFAVTAPLLLMMMVGVAFAGANFDRYLALQQLTRVAANMHSSGVDFSLPEKRALLASAASGLTLEPNGDTTLVLSTLAQTADGPRLVRRFVLGAEVVGGSTISAADGQYDGAVIPPAPAKLDFTIPAGQRVYLVEAIHDPGGLVPSSMFGEDFRLRTRAVY